MLLGELVSVNRRFQKSIRIDTDLKDSKALEGYIFPKSSADVLVAMADHVAAGQCAFTWTGPYGSGKSSLVVALSALLAGGKSQRELIAGLLGKRLASKILSTLPPKSRGWTVLPIVGRRVALTELIAEGLISAGITSKRLLTNCSEVKVLEALSAAANKEPGSTGGLFVFVDELGKVLEGAAQNKGDLYFLQQIAEVASRSGGRLIFTGILHQSFDQYASKLSFGAQDEWSKVQGRFVDLVVNAAGEEQLELLSSAIRVQGRRGKVSHAAEYVADFVRQRMPSAKDKLASLLAQCWPLHPVTASMLGPLSKRRFGQNQRSLFGFLNSPEIGGFQDFINSHTENETYRPYHLWTYLQANLEPTILSSPDGHKWSTAVEALHRAEAAGLSELHLSILKTVALLDMLRDRANLVATPELVALSVDDLGSAAQATHAIEELQRASLLLHKKHTGTLAIFAGSDFELEAALSEFRSTSNEFDLQSLRGIAALQPFLAKRHYHQTGALRWLDVDLVPASKLYEQGEKSASSTGAIGRIILVLPTQNEDEAEIVRHCIELSRSTKEDLVLGTSEYTRQIIELSRELLAAKNVHDEHPALRGDAIARREVLARLGEVRSLLERAVQQAFETATWYVRGTKIERLTQRDLSELASELANSRYKKTPKLLNELLNREVPSSNAVSAQKALLRAMVSNEGEFRLGIEGYPAEGGLFDSLIMVSGLYARADDTWRFVVPAKPDLCRLRPLLNVAEEYLSRHATRSISASELYRLWQSEPFGVKSGLLPVLFTAFALAHRDTLAFYREGIFQAKFGDLDVDVLTADPGSIQLRWMNINSSTRQLLSGMADVVRALDKDNRLEALQPIDVARGLVSIYERLQPWVQRTGRLSSNAVKVRNLFKQAKDPNQFIFGDIPRLYGVTEDSANAVVSGVSEGLQELSSAYSTMLLDLKRRLLSELGVPNELSRALGELRQRAQNVKDVSGDFVLNAFISRLVDFAASDADIEGLASLLVNKPPRDWVDSDLDRAHLAIAERCQQFVKLEAFAHVKGRSDNRSAMSVVIAFDGTQVPLSGEFNVMASERQAIATIVQKIESVIGNVDQANKNIILAALAEVSAQYLDNGSVGEVA